MTEIDRLTGARLLRQLRESRGWSWAGLARALRDTARALAVTSVADTHVASIQRTVARWESATGRTSPGERYQFLLAHLYARTPHGAVVLRPGSDFDALLDALRHLDIPRQRVHDLAAAVARTVTSDGPDLLAMLAPATRDGVEAALRDPARLDEALVDQLAHAVGAINAQIGCVPIGRLQLQLAPVVETCRRLRQASHMDHRARLLLLTTDAFALAARLAFETRDDGTWPLL